MPSYQKLTFQTLLICILIQSIVTSQLPFSVTPNTKYVRAKSISVVTYQPNNTWNQFKFIANYDESFPSDSNISVVLAVHDINIVLSSDYSSDSMNFEGIIQSRNQTSLLLVVRSYLSRKINRLSFRYLLLRDEYSQSSKKISIISFTFTANGFNNHVWLTSPSTETIRYPSPFIDSDEQLNTITFIRGFDLISWKNYLFDIKVEAHVSNNTIQAVISSTSGYPTIVRTVNIDVLVYDIAYFNRYQFSSLTQHYITSSNTNQNNLWQTNQTQMLQSMAMVGLNAFKIYDQNVLDMAINWTTPNGIYISTINQKYSFTMIYLLLATYFCPYSHPFYHNYSNNCLETCPDGTFLYDYICEQCSQGCKKCLSALQCIQCQQGYSLEDGNYCRKLPVTFSELGKQSQNIDSGSESTGAIAGAVVGIVMGIGSIILIVCCVRKCKKSGPEADDPAAGAPYVDRDQSSYADLRLHGWQNGAIQILTDIECCICLGQMKHVFVKTECNHCFHAICLAQWSKRNLSCPKCRKELLLTDNYKTFCEGKCQNYKAMHLSEIERNINVVSKRFTGQCPRCNPA